MKNIILSLGVLSIIGSANAQSICLDANCGSEGVDVVIPGGQPDAGFANSLLSMSRGNALNDECRLTCYDSCRIEFQFTMNVCLQSIGRTTLGAPAPVTEEERTQYPLSDRVLNRTFYEACLLDANSEVSRCLGYTGFGECRDECPVPEVGLQ